MARIDSQCSSEAVSVDNAVKTVATAHWGSHAEPLSGTVFHLF